MAPRRQPARGARGQDAPEGFVRAEDVQRIVQEALVAERAQQAARQEQAPVPVFQMSRSIPEDASHAFWRRTRSRSYGRLDNGDGVDLKVS